MLLETWTPFRLLVINPTTPEILGLLPVVPPWLPSLLGETSLTLQSTVGDPSINRNTPTVPSRSRFSARPFPRNLLSTLLRRTLRVLVAITHILPRVVVTIVRTRGLDGRFLRPVPVY